MGAVAKAGVDDPLVANITEQRICIDIRCLYLSSYN